MKPFPRTAGARVIAPEFLEQLHFSALDGAQPALDPRLAGVALTPLGRPLESRGVRRGYDRFS